MSIAASIISLHRYYIWANRMRENFDKTLQGRGAGEVPESVFAADMGLYMSYWYGALYVVIEGYSKRRLNDATIDQLLKSSNVSLLRRFRNGAFHFQADYFDSRFTDFMGTKDTVPWVRELNSEFGRFFLERIAEGDRRDEEP